MSVGGKGRVEGEKGRKKRSGKMYCLIKTTKKNTNNNVKEVKSNLPSMENGRGENEIHPKKE